MDCIAQWHSSFSRNASRFSALFSAEMGVAHIFWSYYMKNGFYFFKIISDAFQFLDV